MSEGGDPTEDKVVEPVTVDLLDPLLQRVRGGTRGWEFGEGSLSLERT